jgi:hypothetical protein
MTEATTKRDERRALEGPAALRQWSDSDLP